MRVPRPTRATLAGLAAAVGIAVGAGGLSLLLWGNPQPVAVMTGSLPTMGIPAAAPPDAAATAAMAAPQSAAQPVRIDVPSIHVSAALLDLHVQNDGTLQVPSDPQAAGWWSEGPAPGDPGAAIVVGHVDSLHGPAAFYRLSELRPGDRVLIRRADQTVVGFIVDAARQFPKNDFPSDLVYGETPTPTLRLLTCGGSFDRSTGHYTDNLVVFAHAAEPPNPAAPTANASAPPPPGGPATPSVAPGAGRTSRMVR